MSSVRFLGMIVLALAASLGAADVIVVNGGVTTVNGSDPTTAPAADQVHIGGGQIRLGQTGQASGDQAVRGDDGRLTPAVFSLIRDPAMVSVTAAASALANRMHAVSGTSADYSITLPVVSAGTVVGFTVDKFSAADRQYTLDAGSGVAICGRTRYLTLLHTNSALLFFDGLGWQPLTLSLDTPWIDEGPYVPGTGGITGTTNNPGLGTVAINKRLWRRNGQDLVFRWNYRQSTAGTSGSGSYLFTLPRSFVMDMSKIGEVDTAVARGHLGHAFMYAENNGNTGTGYASAYSSTQIWMRAVQSASSTVAIIGSGYFSFATTNMNYGFTIQVPIVNW